ncbi:MAG: cysteine desulfurase family protein [Thermoguttaceae bacterium]|nr:cysteine desulfurase family protein [Thermoguttaceae bacterium]
MKIYEGEETNLSNPRFPIYLDHGATTDLLPEAAAAIWTAFHQTGNPSSLHPAGQAARHRLETARNRLVMILKTGQVPTEPTCPIVENAEYKENKQSGENSCETRPDERFIFTSGATESNHLAIHGIFRSRQETLRQCHPRSKMKLVVSASEHASVMESALTLLDATHEEDQPELRTLPLHSDGVIDTVKLAEWCDDSTALVAVQWVSHETGVIQPIASIAAFCQEHGIPLHFDAVAAAGKIPISLSTFSTRAFSLSLAAHKFGGPCGIGGLWFQRLVLSPTLSGGSQEFGLRAGTEPVALAIGMQVALESEVRNLTANHHHVTQLRERWESEIRRAIPSAVILAHHVPRSPYLSAIAFPDWFCSTRWQSEQASSSFGKNFAKWLVHQLGLRGVYCATGSACTSDADEPSPTLPAMHLSTAVIRSTIRFSFSARQTLGEIDEAVRRVVRLSKEFFP